MKKECIVYPTSRCIRHALESYGSGLLPHTLTMGDFLMRSTLSPGRIAPDDDLRLLALHEASDFSAFSALQIERNFFSFIQNSQYIFRFFEELAHEEVEIEALSNADVYGEYEEHITILTHLRYRYKAICEKNGWLDPIFASEYFQINYGFLKEFEKIIIVVEGYLTRREIKILNACADTLIIEIEYTATRYNQKMTERWRELGFDLEEMNVYRLSLSERRILTEHPLEVKQSLMCEVLPNRLSQIGFIKAQIEWMVDQGIEPENIVVVLPDESFAPFLGEFDTEENFNFAMGESFEKDLMYRTIEAIVLSLDEANVENKARLNFIESDKIEWLKMHYSLPYTHALLIEMMEVMGEEGSDGKSLVLEELHRFSHLNEALQGMDFKAVLRIFMNRLRTLTFDDVRGGKITVMGLLETRGARYDGVIVVDFNEGFVPHKSQKDLFLNTATRMHSSLPTSQDREALQKHYYGMLFNRAAKVAIGCVHNAQSVPSRFLLQLGIDIQSTPYLYEQVLFHPPISRLRETKKIAGTYEFKNHPLSASALKSFLSCKRQFYYKRIAKIAEHEIPRDLAQERDIGNILHSVLEKLHESRYQSAPEMKEALSRLWEESSDPLERYMRQLWLEKLEPFYKEEIARDTEGYRIVYREKEAQSKVEGITLVGRIDRIDEKEGKLEVIDYKSGSYADTAKPPKPSDVDYQLSVYALLAAEVGEVHRCGYYDLTSGTLKFEQFLEEKVSSLRAILRDMAEKTEWEWEMCEDVSVCRYCPYTYLCQREVYHV